jgi:hypothetical protein
MLPGVRTKGGEKCRSRQGSRAPSSALKVRSAVIDGEAIVIGEDGLSDFFALHAALARKSAPRAMPVTFDIMHFDACASAAPANNDPAMRVLGMGDTHASLDYRMSANIVIALVEDARSCRYPSLTRHGSRNLQGRRRQSQKQIRGCKRLRGYLRVDNHRTTLARKLARCEKFALAQTFGLSSAVRSHDVRRGKGPMELGIFGGKAVDRVTALLTISARQP